MAYLNFLQRTSSASASSNSTLSGEQNSISIKWRGQLRNMIDFLGTGNSASLLFVHAAGVRKIAVGIQRDTATTYSIEARISDGIFITGLSIAALVTDTDYVVYYAESNTSQGGVFAFLGIYDTGGTLITSGTRGYSVAPFPAGGEVAINYQVGQDRTTGRVDGFAIYTGASAWKTGADRYNAPSASDPGIVTGCLFQETSGSSAANLVAGAQSLSITGTENTDFAWSVGGNWPRVSPELLGTEVIALDTDTANPAAVNLTIPSACTAVYVLWGWYSGLGSGGLASVTLAGNSAAQIVEFENLQASEWPAAGVTAWYNPPTGVQALDFLWDVQVNFGPIAMAVYVSGGDVASWRSAQAQGRNSTVNAQITLATAPNDLLVKLDTRYDTGTAYPSNTAGWTSRQVQTRFGNRVGRLATRVASGVSEVINTEDDQWSSVVGIAINAAVSEAPGASAGPGLVIGEGFIGEGAIGAPNPATGAVTVNLNGVQAAGAPGALVGIGRSVAQLIGVGASGQVGTVVAGVIALAAVTGAQATGQVGSVSVVGRANVAVTGVQATGQAGALTQLGGSTITLTGVQASGAAGSVAILSGVVVALSGVGGAGQAGTVTVAAAGGILVSLAGVSAAGAPGTLALQTGSTVGLQGVAGSGQAGALAVQGRALVAIIGAQGVGQAGALSVSGAMIVQVPSVAAAAAAGSLAGITGVTVSVPGVAANGAAGVLQITGRANVQLTGVEAQALAGVLQAIVGQLTAPASRTFAVDVGTRVVEVRVEAREIIVERGSRIIH